MLLRTIEIQNYRSLENVELDNLSQFNVIIGRNNSGKSAIFGGLFRLGSAIRGDGVEWESALTAKDLKRSLAFRLVFEPRRPDREALVDILCVAAGDDSRKDAMLKSPLLRRIECAFRSPAGNPSLLHVRTTRILAEDNKWALVQRMTGDERGGNPESKVKQIAGEVKRAAREQVSSGLIDIGSPSNTINLSIFANFGANPIRIDPALDWIYQRLIRFFSDAYMFNPFRHSTAPLGVSETNLLAQDGSNLAQVLHTINSNHGPTFRAIEKFVQTALPDLGMLQTPLIGASTEVRFLAQDGGYYVRLHDMGGGVEQLLMIGTVLLTTGDERTLFVEEPESHLHPGATRFLVEKLRERDRQVFVTTHFPVLLNLRPAASIYRVQFARGVSQVSIVRESEKLGESLVEIGSRNSDVLLSDAVLFVEGQSDRGAFIEWSKTLGANIEDRNITILAMGGGEYPDRSVPVRSDLLAAISRQAPVPHMFVLDRDERSEADVTRAREVLGDRVHFLECRELENYLLIPQAIRTALLAKYRDHAEIVDRLEEVQIEAIWRSIERAADGLYGLVLMKRIRAELGGIRGGLLTRELATTFGRAVGLGTKDLAATIQKQIEARLEEEVVKLGVAAIVDREQRRLDEEWEDRGLRLRIVPGEEILTEVFRELGGEYEKPRDAARLAREMKGDEISQEIKDLMERILQMSDGERDE